MLETDRLDTAAGAAKKQALGAERALEVVTELCVLHEAILRQARTVPRSASTR
jgi:hypothetical protein